MLKAFFSIFLGLMTYAIAVPAATSNSSEIIGWSDLGIVRQIEITAGLVLMLAIGILGAIVLTRVWIRRGYEGLDKVLEGKEVALLMSHIFGFVSLEIFAFMVIFRPEIDPPAYAFYICGLSFVGPEVYLAFNMMKKKDLQ